MSSDGAGGKKRVRDVISLVREKWQSRDDRRRHPIDVDAEPEREPKKKRKQRQPPPPPPPRSTSPPVRVPPLRRKAQPPPPPPPSVIDLDDPFAPSGLDSDFVALDDDGDGDVIFTSNGRPPWMSSAKKAYTNLEQELADFCLWVMPTRKEIELREETIARLRAIVSQTFRDDTYVTLHNFGSWQLQLALPGSDLDFVLIGGQEVAYNPLRKLASSIRDKRGASAMNVVEHARVPIIKYTDIKTSIDVDISFDMPGGIFMGKCFEKILRQPRFRHAKKLVILVKYWLRCHNLHEPFNGGMGSYAVLVLVISLLQHHQSEAGNDSLSSLFRSFFSFYGTQFNWITTGISLQDGGKYFTKTSKGGVFDSPESWKPSLEDPCDPDNNISLASFRLPKIRDAMEMAHRMLRDADYKDPTQSTGILAKLFPQPYPRRIR